MTEHDNTATPGDANPKATPLAEKPEEPPVIARMVIEIRSDGTRTIARGALEDSSNGERVALEAHGSSPMALAASLARNLLNTPLLATRGLTTMVKESIKGRIKGRHR